MPVHCTSLKYLLKSKMIPTSRRIGAQPNAQCILTPKAHMVTINKPNYWLLGTCKNKDRIVNKVKHKPPRNAAKPRLNLPIHKHRAPAHTIKPTNQITRYITHRDLYPSPTTMSNTSGWILRLVNVDKLLYSAHDSSVNSCYFSVIKLGLFDSTKPRTNAEGDERNESCVTTAKSEDTVERKVFQFEWIRSKGKRLCFMKWFYWISC